MVLRKGEIFYTGVNDIGKLELDFHAKELFQDNVNQDLADL